ncbi:MAG: ATP-dependent Clp protease ATP-binding subunit [Tenericutes bacterium]|jgi:ATP-dependent Clp protease ATP-binding subunit ClpC|nr:ATP-dependent Clp protease ATP-binding subunit [Mycoplasmatota bacterium]
MFSKFSEEAQRVLVNAKREMLKLKHPYIGSEHLVLAILANDSYISRQLKSYQLTYKRFKDEIIKIIGVGSEINKWFLYTPLLKQTVETAILNAKEVDKPVSSEHLFLAILEEGEGIAIRLIIGMGIDIEKMYSDLMPKNDVSRVKNKKKLIIEDYSVDLTKKADNNELDPVVGRDKEINRLIEILSRRCKNNPLLIGDAGVGKTAIVEELSRQIVAKEVPDTLQNKRILSLSTAVLVAGTKYRGEFEERISKIIKEVENNQDIILFIDEVHTLVGAGGAEGAIDASNILKPALARGKIKLIGATTTDEYKSFIAQDRALDRRFQIININEPNKEETLLILKKLNPIYEGFHGVKVDDNILKLIIELSSKYIYERKQPDKAIDILDEVCAKVSLKSDYKTNDITALKQNLTKIIKEKNKMIIENNFELASTLKEEEQKLESKINSLELKIMTKNKNKQVTKEDVAHIVNIKTKIPIYEIDKESIKNLNKLEVVLKERIFGQDEAINTIVNITKRIKLGYKQENKPESILLIGKSGVGKTYLIKEYAKELFENNFIRLDMTEFKESHSISKILGAPPGYLGYNDNKNILEEIKNKPHALVLLDEIDKAHPEVLNIFFQILDEGSIKDSKGNVVRFDNNIIFMTANANCNYDNIGFHDNKNTFNNLSNYINPLLINRINHIIKMENLTETEIRKIIKNKLKQKQQELKLKAINLSVNNNIIKEILELSNYKETGARKIEKIVNNKIDSMIIDNIIDGKTDIKISSIV